jgi:hypothetical protein
MLELILLFLRSLSSIATDPALGARGAAIKSVLDLAALAVERGAEGADQLKALVSAVKAMADEGREPTPEEWNTLKEQSDAAHAAIQGWKP